MHRLLQHQHFRDHSLADHVQGVKTSFHSFGMQKTFQVCVILVFQSAPPVILVAKLCKICISNFPQHLLCVMLCTCLSPCTTSALQISPELHFGRPNAGQGRTQDLSNAVSCIELLIKCIVARGALNVHVKLEQALHLSKGRHET